MHRFFEDGDGRPQNDRAPLECEHAPLECERGEHGKAGGCISGRGYEARGMNTGHTTTFMLIHRRSLGNPKHPTAPPSRHRRLRGGGLTLLRPAAGLRATPPAPACASWC